MTPLLVKRCSAGENYDGINFDFNDPGQLFFNVRFDWAGENQGLFLYSPGLSGDFNSDGRVDGADYVVWRNNGGTQEDYLTWRANLGTTAAGGGGRRAHSSIGSRCYWLCRWQYQRSRANLTCSRRAVLATFARRQRVTQ